MTRNHRAKPARAASARSRPERSRPSDAAREQSPGSWSLVVRDIAKAGRKRPEHR